MMKSNLTLLYVEDDETIQENFAQIFEKYFLTTLLANNGTDALTLYYDNYIDIAIIDTTIPEINGFNIAKTIRKVDKKIEIIMLTEDSEKETLIDAINTQISTYLVKPIEEDKLHETLNQVIQKLCDNNLVSLSNNYNYHVKKQLLFYKDKEVKLSKNEKRLLHFFFENASSYHLACDISNVLFDTKSSSDELCNNVVQLISRFKKKMLEKYDSEHFFIDNIYGLGYKITT